MSEYKIGVDPGLSGCIAVMRENEYIAHMHMPVIKHGKSGRVDAWAVSHWIRSLIGDERPTAFIELVGSMPGQGVSTTFTFGRAAGAIESVFMALGFPVELVAPQSWKARAKLPKGEKDGARSKCVMLYPGVKDLRLKGKGQALGDAILIALHGRKE